MAGSESGPAIFLFLLLSVLGVLSEHIPAEIANGGPYRVAVS